MKGDEQSRSVPVAIIGIGCLFPKADDLGSYWANIKNKVDAITDVPPSHWRPEDYYDPDPKSPDHTYARRGGYLSPVPFPALEFGITPNTLEATDTTQLLGLWVARQALEDAGYGAGKIFDRNRVSVILGVTGTLELVIPLGARLGHPIWRRALKEAGVPEDTAADVVQRIADSYVGWQEASFPGLLGNVVAGRIANRLDLGGTNCVVDAACASSLSALHLALLELTSGRCDMVLSGGMDTFNDIFMYMCFSKTPALSPSGNARPFDAQGDGTILGEGLGCLVLKRLADAERDGDKIYAVIRSVGTSSDGKGHAIYAPSPAGQTKALRQAYELAGVTPDMIDLVETHGTGTKAGDIAEVTALQEVYGKKGEDTAPWCAVGSVKSQIGHTKAAAGVAGLIKAALALHHKVLPPTIKVEQPIEPLKPGESPFYINRDKRPWIGRPDQPRRAAVSSFGFGGSNYHCVLEEYQPRKSSIDWDGSVEILACAGATPADLAAKLAEAGKCADWAALRRVAYQSRTMFATAEPCRLTLVLEQNGDFRKSIASAVAALQKQADRPAWQLPEGIFYGTGKPTGSVAVLFPGQGSQYVGMLRDLACQFPPLFESLHAADRAFVQENGRSRLFDLIYPAQTWTEDDRRLQDEALRGTAVTQPALGAIGLGLYRVLTSFGLQVGAAAGHSFGELVALCAADSLSEDDLCKLACARGRLMAQGTGDRGGMLAVRATEEQVTKLLAKHALRLVVANRNTPTQLVLSGATAEIDRAEAACKQDGLHATRLNVAAAFHSPFVAEVRDAFARVLDGIALTPPRFPVFSNATAATYPADPSEARKILAGHLAAPVEFVKQIEAMFHGGVRTFLEVGPGARLTGIVGNILQGKEHVALAVDASSGKRNGIVDLARTLAQLAALGHAIDLARWETCQPRPQPNVTAKPTMTIPLCGANYVTPRPAKPAREQPSIQSSALKSRSPVPTPTANGHAAAGKPSATTNGAMRPAPRITPVPVPAATPPLNGAKPSLSVPPRDALRVTEEGLIALQKLSEQTAQLHRQFLEGQDRALQVLQGLLGQQQAVLSTPATQPVPLVAVASTPPAPRPAPTAAVMPPPRVLIPERKPVPTTAVTPPPRVATPERKPESPPPAAPPVVAARNGSASTIKDSLLAVVAEKTGYPAEMLELEMELDADLGIDSIKRVEIFSALQERLPHAPVIKPEHLGSIRTLRQVIEFLDQKPTDKATRQGNEVERAPALETAPATPTAGADASAILLQAVAEKTGYPVEMLELDMELDGDLGIDSIKRVEIFSILQERLPAAPVIRSEDMGNLRTLRKVVEFLSRGNTNGVKPTAAPVASVSPVPQEGNGKHETAPAMLHRYIPRSIPLTDAPLRSALESLATGEIWITADDSELAKRVAERLAVLGYQPRLTPLRDLLQQPRPECLAGLVLVAPEGGCDDAFLLDSFRLLQACAAGLRQGSKTGGAILASISRLDGTFGLGTEAAISDPLSGGLAGLVKSAAREWPEVACKALDLASTWTESEEAALALVDELLLVGPTEVGLAPTGRYSIEVREEAVSNQSAPPFQPGDVVVITGGARGVTAATGLALARKWQPTLVLLGRTPEPQDEPAWLQDLRDEAGIKRALVTQKGLAPREANEAVAEILAAREVRQTLDSLRASGSQVHYRAVDVRDAGAVGGLLTRLRSEVGPIRGLVHGAGVLADRLIEEKTPEQFRKVYETKALGLQNLLGALAADELRALVVFSSTTARFGRRGQADYALANEVLNKLGQAWSRQHPGCRTLAVNWGPWDGGMVNPSLKRVFEQEGVGVIPLEAGAQQLVQELSVAPGGPVEVLILGGQLPADLLDGAAPAAATVASWQCAFERTINLEEMPILQAHVLDGHPVVPLALQMEWLAHAALHANPGYVFQGLNDLRLFKGIVLSREQDVRVRALVGVARKKGSELLVPVEIRGYRATGSELRHASAEVVLGAGTLAASSRPMLPDLRPYAHGKREIYAELLFHGPALQCIDTVEGCSSEGIIARVETAPPVAAWLQKPLRSTWITDPLAVDGAFQLLILWTLANHGTGSLPTSAGRYRQFRRAFPTNGVRIAARINREGPASVHADIWFLDAEGKAVAELLDYECIRDGSLARAFRRNHLPSEVAPGR